MSQQHHYKTNLRDIEFNLFEAYRTHDYLGDAPFEHMDEETARDVLREIDRLAREEFAASFVESDRTPLELNHGEVELPYGVKKSLDAIYEGGWDRISFPTELGGFAAPPSLGWAVAELLVGANAGQMFRVIENARMLIGVKSTATLSTGYLNALEYATVRKQGAHITQATDKTAPRVEIINHPNVRRMLMEQKAHAEGLRALAYYGAWIQDQARRFPDEDAWERRNDLLLPLIKGYSSEKAYYLLSQSLQVFGGSGYTMDYPMEQYIRDAKIDTIYEGTTGIQALDLFFRKIVRDQGETLTSLSAEMMEMVKGGGGDDPFEVERELLGVALEEVQSHLNAMIGPLMASQANPEEIYKPTLHTNDLLESLAEVVIAWLLLRHAEIAHISLAGGEDAFYEGKIASARYFARTVLPKLKLRRELAEAEDGGLMAMPVESVLESRPAVSRSSGISQQSGSSQMLVG